MALKKATFFSALVIDTAFYYFVDDLLAWGEQHMEVFEKKYKK